MAIKVSKYIVRMQNKKNGILPQNIINQPDYSQEEEIEDIYDSFEDFIDNNPLFYLGHYQNADSFVYVTSSDQLVLHLLENFKTLYDKNDLKTIRNATDSKFKTISGLPVSKYSVDFNNFPIIRKSIGDIEEFINMKDDGKRYPLRFTMDDERDFVSHNYITAIYYFHNDIQSVKDYLSYFPKEQQLTILENTMERFDKSLAAHKYGKIGSIETEIAATFKPVFEPLLLELQMDFNNPINPQPTRTKNKF